MTIYVAEIDGIPLAAFQAETYDNAREIANADWFRADLPWDGEAEISIREATSRERDIWESVRRDMIADGYISSNDRNWYASLVKESFRGTKSSA